MPTVDTKDLILQAAGRLFANQGFAGTSLRSIISAAGVNLAAVHYHFGSKEELFVATLNRYAMPNVLERMRYLDEINLQPQPPTVEQILEAFFAPFLRRIYHAGKQGGTIVKFFKRCLSEPEPVHSLVEQRFGEMKQRYFGALQRALPEIPPAQLRWRFECLFGVLLCVLNSMDRMEGQLVFTDEAEVEEWIDHLICFMAPAMRSPTVNTLLLAENRTSETKNQGA